MWKEIDEETFTMWVAGGAVIRHTEALDGSIASSMVFVPMDFDVWRTLWQKAKTGDDE